MSPLLPLPIAAGLAVLVLVALLGLGAAARRDPRRAPWLREAGALVVLAGLVAGFFWRALFTVDVWMPIGGGDLASFFYPLYSFIYRSIQAGQFPLWNPYAFSGMPLAADVQSGMFYPPNLVAWYTLPSYTYGTLEFLLVLHYAWAALGMYIWLRDWRLQRPAAVAGAAAFAFCGFMTAHFGHMPMIFAASWLPWNLLLARRAARSANPLWVPLAGVALACTFLAGHPQTMLYEALAIGLYWLYLLWSAPAGVASAGRSRLPLLDRIPAAWRPGVLRLPVILIITAGLSAVQLLPSQELAGQSLRSAISYEQATEHAMQPVGLLNLVLPRVYGSNPSNYWVPWQTTENWGYLGIVAVLLAGAALFLRRDRRLTFPVALGVLALLGMLGPFSIIFSWLHGLVPGFDKFRAAGRLLLLLGLANAGLAALGLDALLRLLPAAGRVPGRAPAPEVPAEPDVVLVGMAPSEPASDWLGAPLNEDTPPGPAQRRRLQRWVLMIAALALFVILVLLPISTSMFLSGFSIERGQIVLNDLYSAALWVALMAGLLLAAVRGRIAGRPAALLLAALLVIDLFSPNSHFNPTSTDILSGYNQANAIDYIKENTGPPNFYRMDSDTDISAVWQPMLGTLVGVPDTGGVYNPLELRRYAAYWDAAKADNRGSVLYNLLSVKYTAVLSAALVANPKFNFVVNGNQGVRVVENKLVYPRFFLVHDAAVEPDDAKALGKLANGTILGWHTIYLPDGAGRQSATPSTLEGGAPGERAWITEYTPNRIRAEVDATEAGWAVFSEVWYPGWEATVDGQPVPIERADTLFRAVAVAPGHHTIELHLQAPMLRLGLLISGLTLLLTVLGGLAAFLWYRRARRALNQRALL
jgi:hypothetical protein